MERCICESPNEYLKNQHYKNRNIDLRIIGGSKDIGFVVFENHETIAVFDINYCPKCGKKLREVSL